MKWSDVSFVVKSEQRKKLLILLKNPRTPTKLAKELKSSLPNISLKLKDLEKEGLVECLTPNELKGRIYQLTKKGQNIVKTIEKMEK